jgi:hypothetical protein
MAIPECAYRNVNATLPVGCASRQKGSNATAHFCIPCIPFRAFLAFLALLALLAIIAGSRGAAGAPMWPRLDYWKIFVRRYGLRLTYFVPNTRGEAGILNPPTGYSTVFAEGLYEARRSPCGLTGASDYGGFCDDSSDW